MVVSTSELFWLGLVKGALTTRAVDPPESNDLYEAEGPPHIYRTIIDYADLCGLGQSPTFAKGGKQELTPDLELVRWGRRNRILTATEVEHGRGSLVAAAADIRGHITESDPSGQLATRFDELLEERDSVLSGYSPRTPDILYGMKKSGRIVADVRVSPMPPGILRAVLRILAPLVGAPPLAFMALAAAGEDVGEWHHDWIPCRTDVNWPLGPADRKAAVTAIDDILLGPIHDDLAHRLGEHIGRAERTMQELLDWLYLEYYTLDRAALNVRVLDFIPSRHSDAEDRALDEHQDEETEEAEGDQHDDGQAFGVEDSDDENTPDTQESAAEQRNEWADDILAELKAAIAQVRLGDAELPPKSTTVLACIKDVKSNLEAAKTIAVQLGLDTLLPALQEGISVTTALANEGDRPADVSAGTWVASMLNRREALQNYPKTLVGVIPLAFGELRLKELHSDEGTGLQARSMAGWAKLVENARNSIRDGFTLLKKGFSPYVVINTTQPTLEAIVRKLVEKHLHNYRGSDLGKMLFELLKHSKNNGDEQLESLAAIGLALRLPRNNAVHDPDRSYDKHDAAFFLNGLAIMLRGLA